MFFNKIIKINDIEVSNNSRTFIIAEAGVNHCGKMSIARKLIDAAAWTGADAVKFQAFKAEFLLLKNVAKAPYQLKTTDKAETQFDMLRRLEFTKKQFKILKEYCVKKNILFLVTPFDDFSLELLADFDLCAYKIASTDLTNLPFLNKVARKNKPIILSTGMSSHKEVKRALEEVKAFNKNVILLHCTSDYPAKDNEINLNVISAFKKCFKVLVGYSDHSAGIGAAPYAVALGAKVIEKHLTLDSKFPGPDHRASLEPSVFKKLVTEIRKVECYLGSIDKNLTLAESKTRAILQKSLVAIKTINCGEVFNEFNVTAKRAGGVGLSPIYYKDVFGRPALKNFKKNEVISI